MVTLLIILYGVAGILCLLPILPSKVIYKINHILNKNFNEDDFFGAGWCMLFITFIIEFIWRNI